MIKTVLLQSQIRQNLSFLLLFDLKAFFSRIDFETNGIVIQIYVMKD